MASQGAHSANTAEMRGPVEVIDRNDAIVSARVLRRFDTVAEAESWARSWFGPAQRRRRFSYVTLRSLATGEQREIVRGVA